MPSKGTKHEERAPNRRGRDPELTPDADAEFGGPDAREKVERMLLRKVDIRMLVLILIYIPNYVSHILLIAP